MAVGDDGFSPKQISLWKSFRQPATVRALVIMLGTMFFMQASGVNVVLFYSTSIFQVYTTFSSEEQELFNALILSETSTAIVVSPMRARNCKFPLTNVSSTFPISTTVVNDIGGQRCC